MNAAATQHLTRLTHATIATALTDMDEELAVLEQRREKTRAFKQARMGELFHG